MFRIFSRYEIVLFRQSGKGTSRKLHLRAWVALIFLLFIIGVISCNIWLWNKYFEGQNLQHRLADNQKIIEDQNIQLLSLVEKIRIISDDLKRIERFDAKLRQMMHVEQSFADVGQTSTRREDVIKGELPLYRPNLVARRMQSFLRQLSEDITLEEVKQQDLMRTLRTQKNSLMATPSIWPVEGFISSHFGLRRSPFGGGRAFHKGLDIGGRMGTRIIATAEGTVKQSGYDGAYGISVEVDHGRGIVTKYAHMQRSNVKVGQWVRRGEIIGFIGMTGRTTGPHLHYEVRVGGVPTNPMKYILE